jgi:tellurite resistance protein TerC
VTAAVLGLLASDDVNDKFVDVDVQAWHWIALLAIIIVLLLVDLLVVHREAHDIKTREAAIESAVWIGVGLSFGLAVWAMFGGAASGEYYAGYLIEKSLSVDNVFVWALIFAHFMVPPKYQHRVLFWGIFGALVMRFIFIVVGSAAIEQFSWVLYLFGAFLLFTAFKLIFGKDEHVDLSQSKTLKVIERFVPMTEELDGQKLFTRVNAKRVATPLFAVLLLLEATDVIFAVDSVPAVLAVSREQFIVFASNAFAILGLRALYFLLADMHARFSYLQEGLAIILAFVGMKMIVHRWYHIPTWLSLMVIGLVLVASIGFSLRAERADTITVPDDEPHEDPHPQER